MDPFGRPLAWRGQPSPGFRGRPHAPQNQYSGTDESFFRYASHMRRQIRKNRGAMDRSSWKTFAKGISKGKPRPAAPISTGIFMGTSSSGTKRNNSASCSCLATPEEWLKGSVRCVCMECVVCRRTSGGVKRGAALTSAINIILFRVSITARSMGSLAVRIWQNDFPVNSK